MAVKVHRSQQDQLWHSGWHSHCLSPPSGRPYEVWEGHMKPEEVRKHHFWCTMKQKESLLITHDARSGVLLVLPVSWRVFCPRSIRPHCQMSEAARSEPCWLWRNAPCQTSRATSVSGCSSLYPPPSVTPSQPTPLMPRCQQPLTRGEYCRKGGHGTILFSFHWHLIVCAVVKLLTCFVLLTVWVLS